MKQAAQKSEPLVPKEAWTLRMGALKISDKQMLNLSQLNREVRLERSAQGDLEIGPIHDEATAWRNSRIFLTMVNWAMGEHSGLVFEAGTCFVLPNGAMRYPDVAWVRKSRLVSIALKNKSYSFLPLCPDFVMQMITPTDCLERLRAKMKEYLANGTRLGWLLDPLTHRVYLFSPGEPEIYLDKPTSIGGDPVLPGFSFHPDSIWKAVC